MTKYHHGLLSSFVCPFEVGQQLDNIIFHRFVPSPLRFCASAVMQVAVAVLGRDSWCALASLM
jgi:hypothetical protein